MGSCSDCAVTTQFVNFILRTYLAYHVPSLACPDPRDAAAGLSPANTGLEQGMPLREYAAIRLFVERAAFAQAGFRMTDVNASAVVQICYRLDGIPLAIELAAARVKAMRVEQIAARLDDRFRLLTGGSRTALPRQQTLRALVDWSYSLLEDAERVLLRRLSVFVGGWTLEAAEAVCVDAGQDDILPNDILDLLTHLVNKSLVVLDEQAAEPRYRMLETIRQYAREKLLESDETNTIRDRHLSFCLRLAEDAEPHLSGPTQAVWFARLEKDYTNLRSAYEWSLQESDAALGMRLATALDTFWNVRGPALEGLDWLVRTVSRPEAAAPSLVRARALFATARVLGLMAELVRSNRYAEESLSISRALEYRPGVARALFQLGMNARFQGDLKTSKQLIEQSLAIPEGLESDTIIRIYVNLGMIAAVEGDYDAARKYLEQAMTVALAAESSHNVASNFAFLGMLAFLQGDYDAAEATFERGLNASVPSGIRRQWECRRAVWPTWRCSGGNWCALRPCAGSRC